MREPAGQPDFVPDGPDWHASLGRDFGTGESRWVRAKRDQQGLTAHIGVLVAEVERLQDSK
jgi:hypothetical protein